MLACFFGAINALGISILGEYTVRTDNRIWAVRSFLRRTVNLSKGGASL